LLAVTWDQSLLTDPRS